MIPIITPATAPANISVSFGQIDFHRIIGGLGIKMTPAEDSTKAQAAPSLAPIGI